MVTLALAANKRTRDVIAVTDVTNMGDFIVGTAGFGQLFRPHRISDASNYSVIVGNVETGSGLALRIQYGDPSGTPVVIADFKKAGFVLKQIATLADPGATFTAIRAASDGELYAFPTGTAEFRLARYTQTPTSVLTTTGDMLYASSANTPARLGIGTARQVLAVNSGVTAPEWVASLQSLMTTTGDILQATSANTPARVAIGTALQTLGVNSGATGVQWQASPQSTLTTTGDTLYASGANTLARRAIGSSLQVLGVSGGVPTWIASAASTLTTTGDVLYASAANTLARLAAGSNTHVLTLAGGVPTWAAPAAITFSRKNRIFNGDMRIQQRATVGTTDNSYTLDRWRLMLEAAAAAAVAQDVADTPTNGSPAAIRLTVGSGEDNKFGILQWLEWQDCKDLQGKTVSLQLKMKATAGITDVRAAVVGFSSTADAVSGDPISAWNSAGTNPTLVAGYTYQNVAVSLSPTTSWATYTITGITIGASENNLGVFIWCDDETTTQTTDILRITDVQLEEGSDSTSVERRPVGQELAFCQRYFHAWGGGNANEIIGIGQCVSTTAGRVDLAINPPMRTTPVGSVTVATDWAVTVAAGTITECTSVTFGIQTPRSITVIPEVAAGLAAGDATRMLADTTTSARLYTDAEL